MTSIRTTSALEKSLALVRDTGWARSEIACPVCGGAWFYDENDEPVAAAHNDECPHANDDPPAITR